MRRYKINDNKISISDRENATMKIILKLIKE